MRKPKEPKPANADGNKEPMQLRELARLELRRRELVWELATVEAEMHLLKVEIDLNGIKFSGEQAEGCREEDWR